MQISASSNLATAVADIRCLLPGVQPVEGTRFATAYLIFQYGSVSDLLPFGRRVSPKATQRMRLTETCSVAGQATKAPNRDRPIRWSGPLRSRVSAVIAFGFAVMLLVAAATQWSLANRSHRKQADETLTSWARLGAVCVADVPLPIRTAPMTARRKQASVDVDLLAPFRRWSRAVLAEPGVLATVIVDYQGSVVALAPDATLPADVRLLHGGDAIERGGVTRSLWQGQAVDVAHWPIDRGATRTPVTRVCVVARSDRVAVLGPTGAMAVGWMALVTLAAGFAVCVRRRIEREFVAPLDRMTRAMRSDVRRINVDDLDVGGACELRDLARAMQVMVHELDDVHRSNVRLEASIETTVEQHTRRINVLLARAKRDAQLDSLTGLTNRRFIDTELDRVYAQQRENGGHLAIVMLDLDNFKTLNDTEGHAAGDRVLRLVGELLHSTLRESDVAVRFGGDEFALVLADVTTYQAQAIAERNCRLFAQGLQPMSLLTKVSLSAGVASSFELDVRSGTDLLAAADQALYQSKRAGKNQVAVASA